MPGKGRTASLKGSRGADAQGQASPEGFVVFKGSVIAGEPVPSCPTSIVKLRESLVEREVVAENEGKFVFAGDHLFSSPSAAAEVVKGGSANGLIEWKTGDGRTLKMVGSG